MSFSIPNWPPMFRSRLCDPSDPLYMGRSSDSLRTNTRAQRPGGDEKWIPPGCRVKVGTKAWHLWKLMVKRGKPMLSTEVAMRMDCMRFEVSGYASKLIHGGALTVRKVGRQYEYAIGSVAVVEVN